MTLTRHKVACIVLNWNQRELLEQCLDALLLQEYPDFELVVVDNGSKDDSQILLRSKYSNCHLIFNKENLGFAEGVNQALDYALKENFDYVFLINNDAVVSKNALSLLVDSLKKDSRIGIAGAFLESYTERRYSPYLRWRACRASQHGLRSRLIREVFGCGMLIRTSLLKEIGLFDPSFFAYYEDLDFCRRARRAGYQIYYNARAKVRHLSAVSTGGFSKDTSFRAYLIGRNQILYWRKNGNLPSVLVQAFGRLQVFLTYLSRFLRDNPEAASSKIRGIQEGLETALHAPPKGISLFFSSDNGI